MDESQRREYWRSNLKLMATLLAVWFVVSYLFGILLVQPLDTIVINGFPLGFWFAQQGSIVTFVVLIGIYVWRMDRLDDHYGISDRETRPGAARERIARERIARERIERERIEREREGGQP